MLRRKVFTVTLAIMLLLSTIAVYADTAPQLGDIEGRWSFSVINKWAEKGIIKPNTDGTFRPNAFLTFEQAVSIMDQISMRDLKYAKGILQTTSYGQVEGQLSNESLSIEWLGVPYAAPPIDELRWLAPQPPEKWSGVLATKSYKEKAMQLSGKEIIGSEDCLYLNLYRPNTAETDLPVLVFIHGGNNQTGTSQDFKGEKLAVASNSIVVSIDYRLAALGWINLPALKTGDPLTDSGNFGLLDIHEALTWVNGNIKAFGGNPYNVTLSGQSAGGRDVMAALISPIFKGDFQKAFAISGGMTVTDPAVGQAIDAKALTTLVVEDGIKATASEAIAWLNTDAQAVKNYLRSLPGKRITGLMDNAAIRMSVFPHLFADGYVLPKEGFAVLSTGNYNKVPTLLGSCEDEFSVFAGTDPMFVGALFGGTLATDEVLLPQYTFASTYGSMLYTGFNADRSAEIMADVHGQPDVYAYRFAWGKDQDVIGSGLGSLLGAFHGVDMDFLKGRYESFVSSNYTVENLQGRDALVSALHAYLKNFLYTGNPNGPDLPVWTAWSNAENAGKLMVLDADKKEAKLGMTDEYIIESEVFKAIDADKTLPTGQKQNMIANMMSGRFFSTSFDAHYNGK
ncbi:carboxylesterase family protein [Fusibacter sp. 3D3]|uniref:carboxylesterase family protein n=1 Tax=Fusibacter sp. 3D3 TaxID=1048380 RepID=UPI00085530A5|nr:carboxylesterase family protein [Fusibacter sp. 3D3]GAU76696.1 carboxylesterase, type B [Fusibacter sp. 3D3]